MATYLESVEAFGNGDGAPFQGRQDAVALGDVLGARRVGRARRVDHKADGQLAGHVGAQGDAHELVQLSADSGLQPEELKVPERGEVRCE